MRYHFSEAQRGEFGLKFWYSGLKFHFSVLYYPCLRDAFSKEGKTRAKAAAWSWGYPQLRGGRKESAREDTMSLRVTALSPGLRRP